MMKEFLLGPVKVLLLAIQVCAITFGVWIYVRGFNSIEAPAARRRKFWPFIQERWGVFNAVDVGVSVLPMYLHFNFLPGRMVPVNGC